VATLAALEIEGVQRRLAATHDHTVDPHAPRRLDAPAVDVRDAEHLLLEPRPLDGLPHRLGARRGRDTDERQLALAREQLPLRGGRQRRADLLEARPQRRDERKQAHLDRVAAHGDEHGSLARGEVHRRQDVAAVQRIPSAPAALRRHRERRASQRVEVAVDRADGDTEARRQSVGGYAGATGAEVLGEREEPLGALHGARHITDMTA